MYSQCGISGNFPTFLPRALARSHSRVKQSDCSVVIIQDMHFTLLLRDGGA